jgi:hypothetical protein
VHIKGGDEDWSRVKIIKHTCKRNAIGRQLKPSSANYVGQRWVSHSVGFDCCANFFEGSAFSEIDLL